MSPEGGKDNSTYIEYPSNLTVVFDAFFGEGVGEDTDWFHGKSLLDKGVRQFIVQLVAVNQVKFDFLERTYKLVIKTRSHPVFSHNALREKYLAGEDPLSDPEIMPAAERWHQAISDLFHYSLTPLTYAATGWIWRKIDSTDNDLDDSVKKDILAELECGGVGFDEGTRIYAAKEFPPWKEPVSEQEKVEIKNALSQMEKIYSDTESV